MSSSRPVVATCRVLLGVPKLQASFFGDSQERQFESKIRKYKNLIFSKSKPDVSSFTRVCC
jgi:hypothetical protein